MVLCQETVETQGIQGWPLVVLRFSKTFIHKTFTPTIISYIVFYQLANQNSIKHYNKVIQPLKL